MSEVKVATNSKYHNRVKEKENTEMLSTANPLHTFQALSHRNSEKRFVDFIVEDFDGVIAERIQRCRKQSPKYDEINEMNEPLLCTCSPITCPKYPTFN